MPMLAADTASTTAKPSMILARNRRVGSFSDTDCKPTPTLRPYSKLQHRERELPDPTLKIRAEWIMARKFGLDPYPSWPGFVAAIHVFLARIPLSRGCPGHLARRRASRFCPGMTSPWAQITG